MSKSLDYRRVQVPHPNLINTNDHNGIDEFSMPYYFHRSQKHEWYFRMTLEMFQLDQPEDNDP